MEHLDFNDKQTKDLCCRPPTCPLFMMVCCHPQVESSCFSVFSGPYCLVFHCCDHNCLKIDSRLCYRAVVYVLKLFCSRRYDEGLLFLTPVLSSLGSSMLKVEFDLQRDQQVPLHCCWIQLPSCKPFFFTHIKTKRVGLYWKTTVVRLSIVMMQCVDSPK